MIYIVLILVVVAIIALNLKSVFAKSGEVIVISGLGKTKYLSGKGTLIWRFFQNIEKVIPLTATPFETASSGTTADGLVLNVTINGTIKPKPENVEADPETILQKVKSMFGVTLRQVTSSLNIDTLEELNSKLTLNVEGYDVEFTVVNVQETTGILKEIRQSNLQERITKARLKQQQVEHEVAMEHEKQKAEQEKAMFAREKELGAMRNAEKMAAEKRAIMQQKELDELKATHENEAEKIKAEREKELAEIKKKSAIARAQADSEYNRRMTESKKEVLDIEIANTKKQQALEEEKAKIETTRVKALADNEAYRQKAFAQSEAEAIKIKADSEKYEADIKSAIDLQNGETEAEILRKKGEAKAIAKKLMLQAESDNMIQKAQAYQQYGETAEKAMILEKLPEITKNIGNSLKNVDKMNVYSNDGKGADMITGQAQVMLQQSLDVVEGVTGMNLVEKKDKKK